MTGEVRAITPVSRPPDATVRPPGSKSLTNRALLLAASARGRSTIRGILRADDTEAMAGALRALGARIDLDGTTATVTPGIGVGIGSGVTIDARLSGTTARFILPVAASTGVPVTVDGGPPLRRRPMGPILEALRSLGVEVAEHGEPGCLPVTVTGTEFRGGTVTVSAAQSSQLLGGSLLVGPALERLLVGGVEGENAARTFLDLT
ncbi:MAG: 3-phosphoshikimate 1-carboxyvinyltransferase, partial [Actinobacteria bacterium]|nr:3-phosphoshikimate 1-carboxyvinyltransferase [Actinomycetota bacterium]